ncbi:MAG: adenylosuccinate lyase [Desulfovibrionaceae bacterium]|nr:adenylosuccinate lyase [Desulfovibrionaceae bacterium]
MIERYTRPEMGSIWTLENRYAYWLKVELAVCEAWHGLGVIDGASMSAIREKAAIDVKRILEIEETTRHDVIAFLTSLEEKIGPAARFIHLGCTSSDIVDTAGNMQLAEAGDMIVEDFEKVLASLKSMVQRWRGQLCMGRTHGIHAEPTSFALKMAGFYAEFSRNLARFKSALAEIRVGKISGAVGTYAFLSPQIEATACKILGLTPDPISTQVIQRDRLAYFFTTLAVAAGSIERLCVELRHLQRTEVLEAEEGFGKGQKGSSAMPHKKNPISAENLCGLSRMIRSNSLAAMENQALWHERDISHSSVERVIMPDTTILMDYALNRLTRLLDGLNVIPEHMERNLHASCDLFYSQKVLTALVNSGMPRQEAYVAVQRNAMQSWKSGTPFPDLIRADEGIAAHLSKEKLDELFDVRAYLKYEDEILDRVIGK